MVVRDVYSGHRIGTAEVESALVSHPQCTEAAVVGVEHEVISACMCVRACKRNARMKTKNLNYMLVLVFLKLS